MASLSNAACRACGERGLRLLLDAGPQPISSRYLTSADAPEALHPMLLALCPTCSLIQLAETVPWPELTPQYAWISYSEPIEHLPELVTQILQLPGVSRESSFCGISVNDDPLLSGLAERGYAKSWRISLATDLGAASPQAGVETVQACLGPEQAQAIVSRRGRASVVIARYSFEHVNDPGRFMAALRTLARTDGYIIVEVPDCARALESGDAGSIWEHHVLYFTPASLQSSLAILGFPTSSLTVYPHQLEDSLVCVVTAGEHTQVASSPPEAHRAEQFVDGLDSERHIWRARLAEYRRTNRKVALYGAGHRSCTLINLLGFASDLEFVVDDDPNKAGLFMPGSRLPIVPSSRLETDAIGVCLLSLSPIGQHKVIERNAAFVDRGGTFMAMDASALDSCTTG